MSVRRALAALAVLGVLVAPRPGAAGQESWPPDLGAEVKAALEHELRAAEAAGLPGRTLVLKALEGRSKGATDEQILRAVVALRQRLEVAAAVFGFDHREDVLVAAAGALQAGVGRGALDTLAARTREDALDMALVVIGDLIRRGVPVPAATDAVLSLGRAGADARTFGDFRRAVDQDIQAGLAPARAAEVRLTGALRRWGPGR